MRAHRTLISILGVTVIMNAFYFSFMPMVPVFADRLDVSAFWAGVLASGTSLGSIIGGLRDRAAVASESRPDLRPRLA